VEVVRAKTAGFCMGVILALQKLDELVKNGKVQGPIHTLGPIIHNPQVLQEYAQKGVLVASSVEDIPPEATAVIRAHGVSRDMMESLRQKRIHIIDATCPKVKKAQLLIEEQAREGRMLLLYGEEAHPEVTGLLSYADAGAFIFDRKEKLYGYPLTPRQRYCLAAQTTQDRRIFDEIADTLRSKPDLDVAVVQTICDATKDRQEETVSIARDVDFMVVVGGFESGNTRRLTQVISAQDTPCLHVETARELPLDTLKAFPKIGLTGGASTPKELIDEIQNILENSSDPEVSGQGLEPWEEDPE
jgi:4-hydroxy-3-methylbut-2-enyl diphosphate reductase